MSAIASQKTDPDGLYSLCRSGGFRLKEFPLNGRLLMVLLGSKIIIKKCLEKKQKRALVKKAISYLSNHSDCQPTIYWKEREDFFPL